MNANRISRIGGILAFALVAAAFTPLSARGQVYEGTFTLPFQARWNGLNLPAGDYSIRIDDLAPSGLIVVQHDAKNVGILFVGSIATCTDAPKSELTAVPDGQVYRITGLSLDNRCKIGFQGPKNERRMRARGTEISWRIPMRAPKG